MVVRRFVLVGLALVITSQETSEMKQTLTGFGLILVGSAIILFNERIMRIQNAWNRFTLGITLPENMGRGGAIFVGALMSFYGLLILFRLVMVK